MTLARRKWDRGCVWKMLPAWISRIFIRIYHYIRTSEMVWQVDQASSRRLTRASSRAFKSTCAGSQILDVNDRQFEYTRNGETELSKHKNLSRGWWWKKKNEESQSSFRTNDHICLENLSFFSEKTKKNSVKIMKDKGKGGRREQRRKIVETNLYDA